MRGALSLLCESSLRWVGCQRAAAHDVSPAAPTCLYGLTVLCLLELLQLAGALPLAAGRRTGVAPGAATPRARPRQPRRLGQCALGARRRRRGLGRQRGRRQRLVGGSRLSLGPQAGLPGGLPLPARPRQGCARLVAQASRSCRLPWPAVLTCFLLSFFLSPGRWQESRCCTTPPTARLCGRLTPTAASWSQASPSLVSGPAWSCQRSCLLAACWLHPAPNLLPAVPLFPPTAPGRRCHGWLGASAGLGERRGGAAPASRLAGACQPPARRGRLAAV